VAVLDEIEIGDNVLIGPGVHIYTATHPVNAQERKLKEISKPVSIGIDCWIGNTICPELANRKWCIVGAGSVVTKRLFE
jgi:maltose O-acetyltransferase